MCDLKQCLLVLRWRNIEIEGLSKWQPLSVTLSDQFWWSWKKNWCQGDIGQVRLHISFAMLLSKINPPQANYNFTLLVMIIAIGFFSFMSVWLNRISRSQRRWKDKTFSVKLSIVLRVMGRAKNMMLQVILAYDQGRYQTRLLPWQTGENRCSFSCCSSRIFYAQHADAFCRPVHVRGDLDPFSKSRESFFKILFKKLFKRDLV